MLEAEKFLQQAAPELFTSRWIISIEEEEEAESEQYSEQEQREAAGFHRVDQVLLVDSRWLHGELELIWGIAVGVSGIHVEWAVPRCPSHTVIGSVSSKL